MSDHLEEAKEVLNDLEKALGKERAFYKQVERNNPGFSQVSEQNWQKNILNAGFMVLQNLVRVSN